MVVCGCAATAGDRAQWSQAVKVTRPSQEDALLEAAFQLAVAHGVETHYAARLIGDLSRYVHARTAEGSATTVDMGVILASVRGGYAAGWIATEASRFLLAIQSEMDRDHGLSIEQLRLQIADVKPGRTVDQVLRSYNLATAKAAR